ncbi:AAA family ATPase [Pedobacter sp. L105]|uniref:AAA family ATPase n=1 Tax=Pedobacter sp. L105 TaxID=1641871 RepID=UPI00131BD3A3|nr:ATP-binding protein [Pedobacter sp. L105]
MVRIVNYKLQHFRNIGSAELVFGNYNVIIGTNNSGKSNFIQSFGFLNYILYSASEEVTASFRSGFRGTSYSNALPNNWIITEDAEAIPAISAELEFENTETNRKFIYYIRIRYRISERSRHPIFYIDSESFRYKENGKTGGPVRIFSRHENDVHYGSDFPKFKFENGVPDAFSLVRVLQLSSGSNVAYMDAQKCLSNVLKTPVFYFSHTELTKNDSMSRLGLYKGRVIAFDLESEVLNLENGESWDIFKSALYNVLGIDDVNVARFYTGDKQKTNEEEIKFLRFRHAGNLKTLKELSDGSILLIALIVKVLNSDHDIFLIEEPENSTHPKALMDLVAFLKSFSENKQFIITSHSIVLLNKSKLEEIITSRTTAKGMSEFENASSRKDLKTRLRSGSSSFADELFFEQTEEEFD